MTACLPHREKVLQIDLPLAINITWWRGGLCVDNVCALTHKHCKNKEEAGYTTESQVFPDDHGWRKRRHCCVGRCAAAVFPSLTTGC